MVSEMIKGLYGDLVNGFTKKAYAKMNNVFQIPLEGNTGEEFMAMPEDAEKEGQRLLQERLLPASGQILHGEFYHQDPGVLQLA